MKELLLPKRVTKTDVTANIPVVSSKHIDFYLLKDGYTESKDIITLFKEWCTKEGVIMPKLEWPVDFGNGIVGMQCKEAILRREAYIYVPYKMHFTINKVLKNVDLVKIMPLYPECFDSRRTSECEALMIVLGLFYEITKGQDGYWYPYLR